MSDKTVGSIIEEIQTLFGDFGGDEASADATLWELDVVLESVGKLMMELEALDA